MAEQTALTRDMAEVILRTWLGKPAQCLQVRRLHGGMVDNVLELEFSHAPYRAVIKVSEESSFAWEAQSLSFLRTHSRLRVPEPYLSGAPKELVEVGFLLMERLPGINMGNAKMSPEERRQIDVQLAEMLIELHSHHRDVFGEIEGPERSSRWLDLLTPRILYNWEECRSRLSEQAQLLIPPLLEQMESVFADQGQPTLIHGDIWANNIMVDRTEDGWRVTGLIDPGPNYAEVEFELAYLEVFHTVTRAFFDRYTQIYPLRPGYEIRRLFYWLNTLMLHAWLFGDESYITRTERIARELTKRL